MISRVDFEKIFPKLFKPDGASSALRGDDIARWEDDGGRARSAQEARLALAGGIEHAPPAGPARMRLR
tara:strand:- start:136 stop:339 length:204 start_codon:yes stop_codon:yes gene_type:complete